MLRRRSRVLVEDKRTGTAALNLEGQKAIR